MKRRRFLKKINVGIGGLAFLSSGLPACLSSGKGKRRNLKNWLWYRPFNNMSNDDRKRMFEKIKATGFDAILPEVYNSWGARYRSDRLPSSSDWLEQILPLAKEAGLEVHAWMWSMPCNLKNIHLKHPEWSAVNGKGESAFEKPAYVDYYKFMCPNREGVQEFVQKNVEELVKYTDLDGVHFDYIRFPDVILAEALQPKYNIVQDREYPEYDYCYCEVCRKKFKEQSGIDPMDLEDPSVNEAWRQFRYDSITNMVNNKLIPVIKKHNKFATAAVFPNWWHVRQEWSKWDLDAVLPMLYNKFYNEGIDWIEEMTKTGVNSLPKNISLYSGLAVSAFSPKELIQAIEASVNAGAGGISLFAADEIDDEQWKVLKSFLNG